MARERMAAKKHNLQLVDKFVENLVDFLVDDLVDRRAFCKAMIKSAHAGPPHD
jgi:hypothetical protein